MKEKISLAVDVGGTKILIGEVTEKGQVLRTKRYVSTIYSGDDQLTIMNTILESIDDFTGQYGLKAGEDFQCIGIGLIGRIDPFNGLWLEIEPTRCVTVNVCEIVSGKYKVPVAIDNDVRCGLSAEMMFGQGKGKRNFIYMNVGTGIGAAFLVNGQKMTGEHFNGGEVGHTVPGYESDVLCSCGRHGCVEAVASGMGLDACARKYIKDYPDTKLRLPEEGRVNGYDIFKLADEGDALCVKLTETAVKALAETITNLLWVSDPEVFILGGGLVTNGWLLEKIKKQLNPGSVRFLKGGLVITSLNSDLVGLLGAGAIGFLAAGIG